MKRRTFLLFFICLFSGASVFAQNPDLPLFEEEKKPVPCPACTKSKKPNIGNDAKPVDSLYLMPPPFPAIDVSSDGNNNLPKRPFEGMEMEYEGHHSDPAAYSGRLSAPIDFSATKTPAVEAKIQIKEAKEETDEKAEEKKEEKVEEKAEVEKTEKEEEKKEEKAVTQSENTINSINQQPQVAPVPQKKAVDANSFDIATLQLGMSPEDVIENAAESGFEISNVAYGIPSFMVTNFERDCRENGIYQMRLIHECVRDKAREEDVYYISQLVLKKAEPKEQIVVLFSSTLTDNKAFKIDYTGFGDNSLGTSYKDLLKKTNRRDVFWKYVKDKYGAPSGNSSVLFWGDLNGVFMRAYLEGNAMDGRIILEDATQKGVDYRQAESWNKEQEVPNPFSF